MEQFILGVRKGTAVTFIKRLDPVLNVSHSGSCIPALLMFCSVKFLILSMEAGIDIFS